MMAVIFGLSSLETLPKPPAIGIDIEAIAGHFTVYALLAAAWWAVKPQPISLQRRTWITIAATMLYAVSDEWHQSFVPGRTPDVRDLLVDAIGMTVALAVALTLERREGAPSG